MKIALLQINPTVGDLTGNARLIAEAARAAAERGADLAVTPELALVGYLPRDLLLSADFVKRSWDALDGLARTLQSGPPTLVGLPEPNPADEGRPLFNTAALIVGGRIERRFRKSLLPTYDVFDEDRYFEPFHGPQILEIGSWRLGISICEDVWNDRDFWKRRRYHHDPIEELAARRRAGDPEPVGVAVHGRQAPPARADARQHGAQAHSVPVVYVNQVGGNDDLVFDGRSCAFDAQGAPIARGRAFDADIVVCDLERTEPSIPAPTRRSSRRSGTRWCSAPATTRASAASRAWCSDCRAASTRR